jgi:tape measure domain-containing protein
VGGTAYGLDAAANIASQLTASGVKVGDAMKTALRGVSGVAAMTSSSYEEIGNVFAAVAGQGKAMAMQLNQLSLRGINAASTIADYLGTTEAAVRDMASKGQISFEIFSEAMDSAFGEHAKEANKTFTGAASNIRAALSKIGELFYGPFYDAMIAPLNTIRETISMIKDALVGSLDYLDTKYGLHTTAERLEQIVHVLGDISDILLKGIQNGIRNNLDSLSYVNKILVILLRNLKNVREWLIELSEKSLAKAVVKGKYFDDQVNNLAKIGGSYKNVAEYIRKYKQTLSVAGDSQKKITNDIKNTNGELHNQISVLGILASIIENKLLLGSAIINIVKNVLSIAAVFVESFVDVFIGIGADGIATLDQLIKSFIKFLSELKLSEKALNAIRTLFTSLFLTIYTVIHSVIDLISSLGGIEAILKGIGNTIFILLGMVVELVSSIARFIKQNRILERAINIIYISLSKIISAFNKLSRINFKVIYDRIYRLFATFLNISDVAGIGEGLKYVFREIQNGLDNAIPKLGVFGEALRIIKNALEAVVYVIYVFADKIRVAFISAKQALEIGWKNVKISAEKGISTVRQIVYMYTNMLKDCGKMMSKPNEKEIGDGLNKTKKITKDVSELVGFEADESDKLKVNVTKLLKNISTINTMLVSDIGVISLYHLARALRSMFAPLGSIAGLLTMIKRWGRSLIAAQAFETTAKAFVYLGASVAIFAAVVVGVTYALNNIGSENVWKAVGVVSIVLLAIGAFMFALSKLASFSGAAIILGAAVMLTSISISIAIVSMNLITFSKIIQKLEDSVSFDEVVITLMNVADKLGDIILSFSVLVLVTAMVYLIGEKFKVVTENTGEVIKGAGEAIANMSKSFIYLAAGMFIASLIDPKRFDDVKKLIGILSGWMTVWLVIFAIIGGVTKDSNTFDNAAKLLRSMTVSMISILGTIIILSYVISTIRTTGDINTAIALVASIVIVLGSFIIIAESIMGIEKAAGGINKTAIARVVLLTNSISAAIISMALAVGGLTKLFSSIISESGIKTFAISAGSAFAALLITIGLIFGIILKAPKLNDSSLNAFTKLSLAFVTIASGVLLISFGLAIVAEAASNAGTTYIASFFSILAIMALIYEGLLGFTKFISTSNMLTSDVLIIAGSFLIVSLAIIAISAAITTLADGLSENVDDSIEEQLKLFALVFSSLISSILVIFGALAGLAFMSTTMNGGAVSMMNAAAAFAMVAVGFSVFIEAVSSLAKNKDSIPEMQDIIDLLYKFLGRIMIALTLLTAVESRSITGAGRAGLGFAKAMVAISLAVLAVVAAAKVIEQAKIKPESIESLQKLIWSIFSPVLILSTIEMVTELTGTISQLPAVINSATILISAIAVSILLMANLVPWDKVKNTIESLSEAPEILTSMLWFIGAILGAAFYASVGPNAAMSAATATGIMAVTTALAGGILKVAAALAVMGLAISVFAVGMRMLNGESLADILGKLETANASDKFKNMTDKTLVALKTKGYITGEEYAEGFNRGLWDAQGELTNSGQAALLGQENGSDYADGVADGAKSKQKTIEKSGKMVGRTLSDSTRKELDEHSPSKVGYDIGQNYVFGIANGEKDGESLIAMRSRKLGQIMSESVSTALDTIKVDADAITDSIYAIPSTVNSAIVDANNGFGDFKFDYSSLFDDAPLSPVISPVIDSSEVEAAVNVSSGDSLEGVLGDLSGSLSSLNIGPSIENSLNGLLTDSEGNNFLETISSALDNGEEDEEDPFGSLFGEEGIGSLFTDLESSIGISTGGILDFLGDDGLLGGLKDIWTLLGPNGPIVSQLKAGTYATVDALYDAYGQTTAGSWLLEHMDLFGGFVGDMEDTDYIWHAGDSGHTAAEWRAIIDNIGPGDPGYWNYHSVRDEN